MRSDLNIPHKANRILNLVLLAFILIFLRTWYLSFVQGDYHKQQARRPQRKSIIEKVERATIRDRFNIPLSQNKIDYREIMSVEGSILSKLIHMIYILDYCTIYKSILAETDPSPVNSIDFIKSRLWFSKYNLSVKFYMFNFQYE